jgi:tetratricopeptide (TPR) repeat protein
VGDFQRLNAVAARAAAKGQAQGSKLVVAEARTEECISLRHLGEPKKATAACNKARGIYASVGDRGGEATVLNNLANNQYDQGDAAGAKAMYEQALAAYRHIGNKRGAAGALDNLANVLGDLGDPAGARRLSEEALKMYREVSDYTGIGETLNNIAAEQLILGDYEGAARTFQQALDTWRQTGDRTGMATTLNNMADLLYGQGDLSQAKSKYLDALAAFRETGQKGKSAYPLLGLADVLAAQGELASAKGRYEEVLSISREAGDKHQSASALVGLGSVLDDQGDLPASRRRHEEALAIRTEIGEKATRAESLLALAKLALEEGQCTGAETLARQALKEFHTEKLGDDEILARAVLARTLLVQNKVADAARELGLPDDLARRSAVRSVRMNYSITTARVQAATGGSAIAIKRLKRTLAEATEYGYLGLQLEARLALGETELRCGQQVAGRSRLSDLERDATANGFLLIARKAAKAKGQEAQFGGAALRRNANAASAESMWWSYVRCAASSAFGWRRSSSGSSGASGGDTSGEDSVTIPRCVDAQPWHASTVMCSGANSR